MLKKTNSLMPEAYKIIVDKATEHPGTGYYNLSTDKGAYLCRQCGIALFRGDHKFISSCGWPSFDSEIPSRIKKNMDADGYRIEITCARCDAHLGHRFSGEGYTKSNVRYCVNSASIDFVEKNVTINDSEEAIFAGGCFWGLEYYFSQFPGVIKVESGYIGGEIDNPTYQQVCNGVGKHYEAVRVLYDNDQTDYESLTKLFFELHDPTQVDGQGPDIGAQYQSAIFYHDDQQKIIAMNLIDQLKCAGLIIATKVKPTQSFWPAEDYHQKYYHKHGGIPYCHTRQERPWK